MGSKYEKLYDFLSAMPSRKKDITLSFTEIEGILESRLPDSAYKHGAWWANQTDLSTRPQARAWMLAGFEVAGFHQEKDSGWVRFVRTGDPAGSPPGPPKNTSEKAPSIKPARRVSARQNRDPTVFSPQKDAIYLVSCVAGKRDQPLMAKDLYISEWFLKAKRYVEGKGARWFILSAEYGLVQPDQEIAPYERTLNTMNVDDRRNWAARVIEQMDRELPDAGQVVVFAGQRYREFVMDYLRQRSGSVVAPLSRLRIGEQMSWFDQAVKHESG